MKKSLLFTVLFLITLSMTACSRNNVSDDVLMDQLASDNHYHYTNQSLAFSVNFPEQFIYYQSQKIKTKDYTDVEFFAPTSDREYPQEVQSYGKFLTVRVYDKNIYDQMEEQDKNDFINLAERGDDVFLAVFWDKIPSDWQDKWSEETRKGIIDSFKMN